MKLGVFDSGLGGVMISRAIKDHLPDLDMVYLGDTLHVPYGNRSEKAIHNYSKNCIEYLFTQENCQIIIMACNTASASALRKLQQEWLPKHFPERRILGVVVPTIEYSIDRGFENLGLLGTNYTVHSKVYLQELQKINPNITIHQVNTPLLVPLIEHDGMQWIDEVLDHYMKPLMDKGIEAVILSCTHYTCLKDRVRERYNIEVFSQDEIVPVKLKDYLDRHPESETKIGKSGADTFLVTDLTPEYTQQASRYFGKDIELSHVLYKDTV
mgnify:CR=1 FL=1